jgi:hypothetical protein
MTKKIMNLTEYAAHINRSVPLISRWCQPGGKLSRAIKMSGKRKLLRVKIADAILEVSMDLSQQRLTAGNDHQQNIPNKQVADHLVEGKASKQSDKTEKPKSIYGYQDALIKDKYYAAALKKLDLDQKNGILVLKMDVEKEAFECARMVRDALQNIPSRVAAVIAAMKTEAEVEKILDKEIRQSLEVLAK